MSGIRRIGFLLHPGEETVVRAAIARAQHHGFATWTAVSGAEAAIATYGAETSVLVTVGGDGTFLYGARLAAPLGIPVLGVNRGRLGFLTDVEVDDLPGAMDCVAAGGCARQTRAMLQATSMTPGGAAKGPVVALNEVAVKSLTVSVARLRIDAGGELLGEFDADGVVIATATGSTAYALSAGGPLVDPQVPARIVVPLAPHAVMARAIVLPEAVGVRLIVLRGYVQVAVDGISEARLGDGGEVVCDRGPELEVFRLPGAPSFLQRLRDKLHFGVPLKPVDRPGDQRTGGAEAPAAGARTIPR